jgi:hypothetical protein
MRHSGSKFILGRPGQTRSTAIPQHRLGHPSHGSRARYMPEIRKAGEKRQMRAHLLDQAQKAPAVV